VDTDFVDDDDFSDSAIVTERIKVTKYLFLPSGHFFWEVQSRKNKTSYYVDNVLAFCSCKGFYYNYNRKKCYHLSEVSACVGKSNYKISLYGDEHLDQVSRRIILQIISGS
jgi:predicted nucleic acid-binding Zn finger protein